MNSPIQVLVSISRLVRLLASWVARGIQSLACLLEPAHPPAELPLATPPCAPFCASSEGVYMTGVHQHQTEDSTIDNLPLDPSRKFIAYTHCNLELNEVQRGAIHGEKRKVYGVLDSLKGDELLLSLSDNGREQRANLASLLVMEEANPPPPTSSTQSGYHTPSSLDSITFAPLISSFLPLKNSPDSVNSDSERRQSERLSKARKFEAEIGDLGRRRGFKGAPLFIQGNHKYSPFLSLQNLSSRSPTSSTSISPRSATPRTPLSAVTNMIRTVSSKPVDITKEIPEDLQKIIEHDDPFAASGDTFFAPTVSFGDIFATDLDNFGSYCQNDGISPRKLSIKHRPKRKNPRVVPPSVASIDLTSSPYQKGKLSSEISNQGVCASPKIVVTVPSAPSSPTKADSDIVGGLLDSGTKSNVVLDVPHPHDEASPPGVLPVSDLLSLHTNNLCLGGNSLALKRKEKFISPDQNGPEIEVDDKGFVVCVSDIHDANTENIVYNTTTKKDVGSQSGFDPSRELKCMPESREVLTTEDLYDFDIYKNILYLSPEKTCGNYRLNDSLLLSSKVEIANMETTIYDLSICSEDIQSSYDNFIQQPANSVHHVGPDQSHLSQSDQKPVDGSNFPLPTPNSRNSTLRPVVLAAKSFILPEKIEDHRETLICFSPETRALSSEEKLSFTTHYISRVIEPRKGRRSHGLDEIIALLDASESDSTPSVVPARRSIVLGDDLWDEGTLFELYAI